MNLPSIARLLALACLGLSVVSGAHAARLYGNSYVRVGVPDLAQAQDFFRQVLDCRLIGPDASNGVASILLSCDEDSVVELFRQDESAAASSQPLQFIVADVEHADGWLRRAGVAGVGSPHVLASGPLAGRTVIDFASPWGLPLRLLGRGSAGAGGAALATAGGN